MPRWFSTCRLVQLLWLGLAGLALADQTALASTLRLAATAPPAPGGWATLRVNLPRRGWSQDNLKSTRSRATTGARWISIGDARGGPTLVYRLHDRHALVALPYMLPAALPAGRWPLQIRWWTVGGKPATQIADVRVPLPIGPRPVSVAVPRGASPWINKIAVLFKPHPVAAMPISDEELRRAAALVFASCRAMLLTRRTTRFVSLARALALLNVGVSIISLGHRPPGRLAALGWRQVLHNPSAAWLSAAPEPPEPLLVPRLARLPLTAVPAPASWRLAAILCGPLALLLIFLIRLVTRPRFSFLAGCAAALIAASGGAIYILNLRSTAHVTAWSWDERRVPGTMQATTTVSAWQALRPRQFRFSAAGLTLPLCASAAAWLATHVAIVPRRQFEQVRLCVTPEQPLFFSTRQILPAAPWPAASGKGGVERWLRRYEPRLANTPDAALLARGRIWNLSGQRSALGYAAWLDQQPPALRATIRCWFALRFQASHRYLLHWNPARSPPRSAVRGSAKMQLEVDDFSRALK